MEEYLSKEMQHFNYLISETNAAYHEAAVKLGLSDSTHSILYTLCNRNGSCPLSELSLLSGISKQTINSALRKLEAEEIVYLQAITGKKKSVCLTEKGEQLVQHTVLQIINIENNIFDSWSETERNLYLDLTRKYLVSFKEQLKKL